LSREYDRAEDAENQVAKLRAERDEAQRQRDVMTKRYSALTEVSLQDKARAEAAEGQIAAIRQTWDEHRNRSPNLMYRVMDALLAVPPVTETTLIDELGAFSAKLAAAQRDLPADAAKVLRENLWMLYDSLDAPATPAKDAVK